MIVDCEHCVVRGEACGDCVITVLLGAPPGGVELDGTERRALDTLAAAGLVPRLRLVGAEHRADVPGDEHRDRSHGQLGHGAGASAEWLASDAERPNRHAS